MAKEGPDRYEPLPALPELPAWLWRRTPPAGRAGIAALIVGIVVAAVVLAPGIGDSTREAQERATRAKAARDAQIARELAAEQRPITRRARPPGHDAHARARMLDAIAQQVLEDARARVAKRAFKGPIRRVACEPFPNGSEPADRDPRRRRGRYSCIAVTAEFEGGVLGHQYRVAADFATGRYGFCKITGRAGPERDRPVTIPAACGGDDYN